MTRRRATRLMLALLIGGLVLADGSQVSAQMGPGMMGGQGMMGQGQAAQMPMPQAAAVIQQLAERLAQGKRLEGEKAERLRRLTDQLVAAAGRMSGGMGGGGMMGGMMGGGMMGQAAGQMDELSRILAQIAELVREP